MASLGQMLANIAHQWRQPLTELSLTVFNLKKSAKNHNTVKLDKYYKESLGIIENMSQTIDDFTNFFNPNKPKEKFFLDFAVDDALLIAKKLIQKEDINLTKEFEKVEVFGVLNELSQVIINLVQNSSEAFVYKDIDKKNISIKISKSNTSAIIIFEDNAGGIDDSILDKIFEPYFTTKHQSNGTGLGLFMSKMIIEKSLNGTISALNIKNGMQFVMKIPLKD
jgi:C4-dicarboxylate-specific signal transduction histidine kinase